MNYVICGYPRSGSTMFYNMLRGSLRGFTMPPEEISAIRAGSYYLEPMITKFPSDVFYAKEILKRRPDTQFIVTLRDPRSVLCSKHKTTGDMYKVSWDRTFFGEGKNKLGRYQAHWGLVDWDNAIDDLGDTTVKVYYEDLVRDPDKVQNALAFLFDWTFTGLFSDFHAGEIPPALSKQLNGVRPVERDRIFSWHDHPERIKQQFSECPHLFEIVKKRGYERDDTWIEKI